MYSTAKGSILDTVEKEYIHKEMKINNHINDKCTVKPNAIFDTVVHKDTSRAH
jgi:hypothetical protein